MKLAIGLMLVVLVIQSVVLGQVATAFRGKPLVKISEEGTARVVDTLSNDEANNLMCVIMKIGNRYYWTSRGFKELNRREEGAYINFVSSDSTGSVKIIRPEGRAILSIGGNRTPVFDYVEYQLVGLTRVTYFGFMSE